MAKALAAEFAPGADHVKLVTLGWIATDRRASGLARTGALMGFAVLRTTSTNWCASVGLHGGYITGQTLRLSGGLHLL